MPYTDVNGIHLYFQEHGLGPPLVLLHGGLLTIELSFGAVIPALAEHHRIIAIELQGHGRTADIDRPITFEYLAADVVGLLDHLGVEQTDVFGFSFGGLTTYQLLVDHQRRIRRAVVASADHRNDRGGEIHPERRPTEADFAAMRDAYAAVAPDPAHFEAFAEKAVALVHGFAGWTDDKLRAIKVPVLVLIGDTDFILVANAAQAAELLPHGQLAVLPGTTHIEVTRSELVPAVVEAFPRPWADRSAELSPKIRHVDRNSVRPNAGRRSPSVLDKGSSRGIALMKRDQPVPVLPAFSSFPGP